MKASRYTLISLICLASFTASAQTYVNRILFRDTSNISVMISDTAAKQRPAPALRGREITLDSLISLFDIGGYIENDSVCLVFRSDTLCIDGAVGSGGGGADTHIGNTNITFSVSPVHDVENENVVFEDIGLWRFEDGPVSVMDGTFGVIETGALRSISMNTGTITFNRATGADWDFGRTTDGSTDIFLRPSSPGSFVIESGSTDLFTFRSGLGSNQVTWLPYDSTPTGLTGAAFGLLGHMKAGNIVSVSYDKLIDSLEAHGIRDTGITILDDIPALMDYEGGANFVYVKDSLTGGYFFLEATGEADTALIIPGPDRLWHRIVIDNRFWLTWWAHKFPSDTSWTRRFQHAIDTVSNRHEAYGDGTIYVPDIGSPYYLDTIASDPYFTGIDETRTYCIHLKPDISIVCDPHAHIMLSDSMVVYSDSLARVNMFIGNACGDVSFTGGIIDGNAQGQYQGVDYYGQTAFGNHFQIYDTLITANPDTLATIGYRNKDITWKDVTLTNHSGNAINTRWTQNVTAEGVRVDRVGEGIQFLYADNVQVHNYYINDSTDVQEGDGIELGDVHNANLDVLRFDALGGEDMGSAIDVFSSEKVTISNMIVNGWHSGISAESFITSGGGSPHSFDVICNNLYLDCHSFGIDAANGSMYVNNAYIKNANNGITALMTFDEAVQADRSIFSNVRIDSCQNGVAVEDSTITYFYDCVITNTGVGGPIRYYKDDGDRPFIYWHGGSIDTSSIGLNIRVDQEGDANWFPHGEFVNIRMSGDPFEFQNSVSEYGNFKLIQIDDESLWINQKLRVIGTGSTGTSITGRDATGTITNIPTGFGLSLSSGTLRVDTTNLATLYDISGFGNGIFEIDNDGATVPTSFNVGLTDWIEFGGNVLYINTSNNRVGILDGSPSATFSVGDRGAAASRFSVDVNTSSSYEGTMSILDAGLQFATNSGARSIIFDINGEDRITAHAGDRVTIAGNEANNVIPILEIVNAQAATNDNFQKFTGDWEGRTWSAGVQASSNRWVLSQEGTLGVPVLSADYDDDITRSHMGFQFEEDLIDVDGDDNPAGHILIGQGDGNGVQWVDTTGLFGGGGGTDTYMNVDSLDVDLSTGAPTIDFRGFPWFTLTESPADEFNFGFSQETLEDSIANFIADGVGLTENYNDATGLYTLNFDGLLISGDAGSVTWTSTGTIAGGLGLSSSGSGTAMTIDMNVGELDVEAALEGDEEILVYDANETPTHERIELDEATQDIVGAMVTGNTETGITVTYEDSDGTIDFVAADASATNEAWTIDAADDADTEVISNQTVTFDGTGGLTVNYDPNTNTLQYDASGVTGSADGNGIFDATNDGGTVPSDMDVNITDDLNFDATVYIDAANSEVGINTTGPDHYLDISQTADTKDGVFIESTTTADELATLNLRGRQDGTDGNSSRIYFSNHDDDVGATSATTNLAMIELDRSVGDDEDGILTLSTFKVNATETEHIILDAADESTQINRIMLDRTTQAGNTLNVAGGGTYHTSNSGAVTINLPDADTYPGAIVYIYTPATSGLTINGGSGDSVINNIASINQSFTCIAFAANIWECNN